MSFDFIKDGNISRPYRVGIYLVGLLLFVLPVEYMASSWISKAIVISGAVVMAVGGYTSWANTIGLKPFDNSYKKARESYEKQR